MGVETALLVGTALASTAATVSSSQKAQAATEDATRQQKAQQSVLEQQNAAQTQADDETAQRDKDRAAQRALMSANSGRSSTILTSPLGVSNAVPAAAAAPAKTTLGS